MNNNRDFFLRPNQGDRDSSSYGRTGPIASDVHDSWLKWLTVAAFVFAGVVGWAAVAMWVLG